MPALPRPSLRPLVHLGAALLAVVLAGPDARASEARLRLVKLHGGTGEVRMVEDGRERLLDRFPEPISVQDSQVSPDGHRAFVWYHATRPPLLLSIYDLRTGERTARFAPGYGGEMHFTPKGNIVHDWGCGAPCAVLALYDVHGKKLLEADASGIEISPTRRFAVTGPVIFGADEPVVVYDLDAARKVYTQAAKPHHEVVLGEVRWDDATGRISIALDDLHGRVQRVVVQGGPRE